MSFNGSFKSVKSIYVANNSWQFIPFYWCSWLECTIAERGRILVLSNRWYKTSSYFSYHLIISLLAVRLRTRLTSISCVRLKNNSPYLSYKRSIEAKKEKYIIWSVHQALNNLLRGQQICLVMLHDLSSWLTQVTQNQDNLTFASLLKHSSRHGP